MAPPSKTTISQNSPEHLSRQLKSYTPFPVWLDAADLKKREVSGRAGVTTASLTKNGVHRPTIDEITACYVDTWGLGFVIPYYNLPDKAGNRTRIRDTYIATPSRKSETKPYVRIRLDKPTGDAKYKQAYGTTQHVYIPEGLEKLCCEELVLVEGEIKAISLVEEGIPAVGIGGIYGIQAKKDEKHPELVRLIPEVLPLLKQLGVKKIYFLGDGDTSLNWQFSDAAVKYSALLTPIPVYLPRIPLDEPKGIDDVKAIKKTGFLAFWKKITKAASLVESLPLTELGNEILLIKSAEFRKLVNTLCFQLIDEQMAVIAGPKDINDDKLYFYRFTQIYSYIKSNADDREAFFKLCDDAQYSIKAIVEAGEFTSMAKSEKKKNNKGKNNKAKYGELTQIEKDRLKEKIITLHKGKVAPESRKPGMTPTVSEEELPLVLLPGGNFVPFHESAQSLFKILQKTKKYFIVNGAFMYYEIDPALQEQGKTFTLLNERELQTRVSKDVRFGYQLRDEYGDKFVKENQIPTDKQLATFIGSAEKYLLPKITGIHKAPILVSVDKTIKALQKGYNPEAGGRYIKNGVVASVPLKNAIENIKELLAECPFATPSDYSRALCALITPAMIFGRLFTGHCPAFMFEADGSQTGKGILSIIVQRVYGERGYVLTPKEKGGVGSLDETLDQALLYGEPFIQFDNFRDKFPTARLESILTVSCEQPVLVRVPYQNAVGLDPSGRIFHLTSNGLSITPDLANRLCIVKLRKSEKRYSRNLMQMENYIAENQETLLGSIFEVISAWVEAGEHSIFDEKIGVGGFQQWWQTMEWICANILSMPSPYVDVAATNTRATNNYLSWLRLLAIEIKNMGYNEKELTPTFISDICLAKQICVIDPSGRPLTMNPGVVGSSIKTILKVFGEKIDDGVKCVVDGYCIKLITKEERREVKGGTRENSYYIFSYEPSISPATPGSAEPPPVPQAPPAPLVPSANAVRPVTFGKIDQPILDTIASLSRGGPTYDELIQRGLSAGIQQDVVTTAILVMVNTGQLTVFDEKFFPCDADGNPLFSNEDVALVQKIAQSGNSQQVAMMLTGSAYQLLTQGTLSENSSQALRRFQEPPDLDEDEDADEYSELNELPKEEATKPRKGIELRLRNEFMPTNTKP